VSSRGLWTAVLIAAAACQPTSPEVAGVSHPGAPPTMRSAPAADAPASASASASASAPLPPTVGGTQLGDETPIELPLALALDTRLEFRRELPRDVDTFLLQGKRVWVRAAPLPVAGTAGPGGDVWLFNGRRWEEIPFYGSFPAVVGDAQFQIGAGRALRLVGLAGYCCGEANVVGWQLHGRRWVESREDGVGLPRIEAEDQSFIDSVSLTSGTEPLLCTSGNPRGCWRWGAGRWTRLPLPPAGEYPSSLVHALGGRTVALLGQRVYELRGTRWAPITTEFEEPGDSSQVRQGAGKRLWVVGDHGLRLWTGNSWSKIECPITTPRDLLERSPNDVWVVGTGLAHYDGVRWKRALGVPGTLRRIAAGVGNEIWVGGSSGLWRGQPRRGDLSTVAAVTQATARDLVGVEALVAEDTSQCYEFDRVPSSVVPGLALQGSAGLAATADALYFTSEGRLQRQDAAKSAALDSALLASYPRCRACLVGGGDQVADVLTGVLRVHTGSGPSSDAAATVPGLAAADRAPDGAWWIVGNGQDPGLPRVARVSAGGWTLFDRLLPGGYAGLAAVGSEEAWLVGASDPRALPRTGPDPDGSHASEDEEVVGASGVLDHVQATVLQRYRVPDTALLGVATTSDGTVVAAGVGGTVLMFRSGRWHLHRLSPEPTLEAPTLHFVYRDRDAVWIGGEQGLLLRWDGAKWQSLHLPGRVRPTFTSMTRWGEELWVAGPEGRWRLRRRGGSCP